MHHLITLFLRLTSLLPLRINHALGACIGWCCWILPTRQKINALTNLALCFPEKSVAERQTLARNSLIESGKSITETGWFWYRSRESLEKLIDTRQIDAEFENLPAGTSVVIVAPHFGAWEICTLVLSRLDRPLYLYRPPRNKALEPLLIAGRKRFGAELVPVTRAGLKRVFQALRAGRPVGILPDQEPDLNGGIFSEFFNVPANTMTLLARLLDKSKAQVFCLAVERKPAGRGYTVHKFEPHSDLANPDAKLSAKALNATVERCVAINPAQYLWNYRRFRLKPDGSRRSYSAEELKQQSL